MIPNLGARSAPQVVAQLFVLGAVLSSNSPVAAQNREADRARRLDRAGVVQSGSVALTSAPGASVDRPSLFPPCLSTARPIAPPATRFLQNAQQEASSSRAGGIVRGLVIGVLLGGVAGYALDVDGNDLAPEHAAAMGAGMGALVGSLFGGVAGSNVQAGPRRHTGLKRGITIGVLLGGGIGFAVINESHDSSRFLGAVIGASTGALAGGGLGWVHDRNRSDPANESSEAGTSNVSPRLKDLRVGVRTSAASPFGNHMGRCAGGL